MKNKILLQGGSTELPFFIPKSLLAELCNLVPLKPEWIALDEHGNKTLQKANDAFHQDNYHQAISLYNNLLLSRPDILEAWLGLTISYLILGDYPKMQSSCRLLFNY
jgi:hypothetical protein